MLKEQIINKWANNRTFSKEEIQMSSKYMKKCSSLVINGMHIQSILRFHFVTVRMAIIKELEKRLDQEELT
jgi:hypothetical protein